MSNLSFFFKEYPFAWNMNECQIKFIGQGVIGSTRIKSSRKQTYFIISTACAFRCISLQKFGEENRVECWQPPRMDAPQKTNAECKRSMLRVAACGNYPDCVFYKTYWQRLFFFFWEFFVGGFVTDLVKSRVVS